MSVKHKPLHWYCTLLSENPLFSYNSPLLNQKHECYFKSKYPVNMTDEEWLQVLEKSFKFWSSSLPPFVHTVWGKGGYTFATVECLLLVVIWQFFLCGFNFSCSWRHCIQISQIRVWSARNDATSDNWVLPIIKCTPVVTDREQGIRSAIKKSLPSNPILLCWNHLAISKLGSVKINVTRIT